MNKTNIILLTAAIVLGIYLFLSQKTADTTDKNLIIVGTNAEFPPFTFINERNEIVGFDIDIAAQVIKRMGKTIEIKDRSFDMLIPEAQNGSVHILAAGMTATPERAQMIDFTRPYLKGEPLVVITLKQHPITALSDLKNHEVIVNEGYTADAYMSAQPDIQIKRLPSPAESMLDLQTGKSFAYVSALNAVKPFIEKIGADQFNIFTIEGTQENTAMGISKKYPELLHEIQPILDQMEADGTIEALKKKWNIS
jgi:polar amino acid transport system substrate-binding protein